MFKLRPDIVVETDKNNQNYECIIIDTKWKAIDKDKQDRNYLMDIKDMYQLYAYGQKYRQGQSQEIGFDVIPKLVLLYPYSEKFTERLSDFVYEEIKEKYGLRLMVVPFDLTGTTSYEEQIQNILNPERHLAVNNYIPYEEDIKNDYLPQAAEPEAPYGKQMEFDL